jgi:hypothetical protein
MTEVVATSRKEKTRQRWNNYTGLVILGFENGSDNVHKPFGGGHYNSAAKMKCTIAFELQRSGAIKLLESHRAVAKDVEHKG